MSRGSLSHDGSYSRSDLRRVSTPLNPPISEFLLAAIGVDCFVFDAMNQPRKSQLHKGETMAAPTAGITFRETMEGWFSLNEADPRNGQEKGKRAHTRLTITPIVTIENLDRMQFDREHRGTLESSIRFAPLFGSDEPVGSNGTFKLFAPSGNTQLKLMIYEFGFQYRMQDYYFYGQKGVENDCGGLDVWKDTTTLFSKLYKGNDRSAPVVGAGVLRITLPGFLKQLSTMRVTNAPSGREKLGAYLTFANFFAGQLCDTYMKR